MELSVTLEYIKSVSYKHHKWLLEAESFLVETNEVNNYFVNDAVFRDDVMERTGTVVNSNRSRIA